MRHSVSVTCCALLVSSFSLAYAADVPGGTVLAEKQELVRHIKDEPASLDPAKAVGLPEIQVIRDLFEGLVNQNEKGEIIPGVASQWKSNDNRIWTFTLRDNAQWADGTPVTAQDFVYSWQRLVDPKTLSPFAWFAALAGITNAQAIIDGKVTPDQLGVSAVDAHTLRVQLDKPLPWFASLTASFAFYPVQKANVESGKDWMKPGKLIGNGAYVLKERVVNEKLVVEPNTHYWDNAKTVLQKVTFLPINQESAATKRYLAGDIDITESFPKNMYQKLLKDIPGQVYTPPQLGTYYYAFNTQKGPTADSRVRLALSIQLQGSLGSGLILPQLPLTATDGQEYSLYLTVTDSRGTRVTSERIPVRVTQDETSFRSWINVINDDVQVEDGNFVISTPLPAGEEGKVIEWHYVRERSEEEWTSLKPRHIKYQSDMPGLAFKALGGTERDGHWVERVLVTHIGDDARSLKLHIEASGPDDKHPVKGTVLLQAQSDSIAQKVTSVEVLFTPGTEEANGSVTAPVVGTEMRARTLCVNNTDCTDAFNYQWEISDEMKSWQSVPGATKATWLLPYSLNGESLQNKYIRVRIISDKENAKSSTAASDAN
ncbi:peptide ABC transporter substrate-binding protein [Salmonella enterica subsp. enterica serovar Kentucky]|nr:peptide ABC transporter substrate-binding protein [Salmonella enterica subsp. enterica serovar Kentucky]